MIPGARAPSFVYQVTMVALSDAEIEVSNLATKVAQFQARVDELRKSVDSIPEVEAKLASLNRDYDITKAQYEGLVRRLESARLSEQAEQSNEEIKFRIIEPPVASPIPVNINRPLFLSIVLAAGFLGGLGMAFLLNQLRPVFLDSRTLIQAIGLPVFGVISLQRPMAAKLRHRLELACLALGALLLTLTYAGAVRFHEHGAHAVQALTGPFRHAS